MPFKTTAPATDVQVIDRFDDGVGWIAHPEETMQRASHAIATDAGALVIDPVDGPGVDELIEAVGEATGVAVCFDQHARDAVSVADRHDVPLYVPEPVRVAERLRDRGAGSDNGGPPIERVSESIPGTDVDIRPVHDRRAWHEAALFREADGLLYVAESVGTAAYFRASGEALGVHPMARLFPPRRALSGLGPDRVLVGHGAGVHETAAPALDGALAGSRRRLPSAYWNAFRSLVGR
jgi:hypothetical protein